MAKIVSRILDSATRETKMELKPHMNLQVGDIVLVADSNRPRNSWQMGRIVETFPDGKGFVRQAKIQTSSGALVRPISKLCLIVEVDTSKPEVEEVNDHQDSQSDEWQASDEPRIKVKESVKSLSTLIYKSQGQTKSFMCIPASENIICGLCWSYVMN